MLNFFLKIFFGDQKKNSWNFMIFYMFLRNVKTSRRRPRITVGRDYQLKLYSYSLGNVDLGEKKISNTNNFFLVRGDHYKNSCVCTEYTKYGDISTRQPL